MAVGIRRNEMTSHMLSLASEHAKLCAAIQQVKVTTVIRTRCSAHKDTKFFTSSSLTITLHNVN